MALQQIRGSVLIIGTSAPLGKETNIFNTSSAKGKLSNKEGKQISGFDQATPMGKIEGDPTGESLLWATLLGMNYRQTCQGEATS